MLQQEDLKMVKDVIKEFFEKMDFEVEREFISQNDLTLSIHLKSEEPQILIGDGGQTLLDIQHLLKAILKRKIKENFYLDLDINDYKGKKIEYLKEMARSLADEVALMKKEKILPAMRAFERRIIHLELAGRQDVTTESIGEEPERKIVIKPYP